MRLALAALVLICTSVSAAEPAHPLIACADPNNMPFSNQAQQGFENKIMALVARDLDRPLEWVWWAQRRGYVRNTLDQSKCDVWPGIAAGVETVAATDPYYRSSYVFVVRRSSHLEHLTRDDPHMHRLIVGVQMIGNDSTNTPPAHAIAARGIVDNVRGYMVYGDYSRRNPSAPIIEAVARRQIDVALAWGPMAGYFATRSKEPLEVYPVIPADDPRWPMSYDISMGVRHGDRALLQTIDASLRREHRAIESILREFRVPLAPPAVSASLSQPPY
jgi:mxaJ protein